MQVGLQAKFRYTNTYATIALWILCLNSQHAVVGGSNILAMLNPTQFIQSNLVQGKLYVSEEVIGIYVCWSEQSACTALGNCRQNVVAPIDGVFLFFYSF